MSQTHDTKSWDFPGSESHSARVQLQKLVADLVKQMKGGYDELAGRIAAAQAGSTPRGLDRRKLSQLAKGTARNVSMEGLDALNFYLIKERGFGLGTVFATKSLIEAVAERGKVTVILGARHGDKNTTVSLWDFRCMERILRGIYRNAPMTHVEVQDVPLPLQSSSAEAPAGQSAVRHIDDWYSLLDAPQGPSLICLGSQRTCLATEVLLSRMFGVQPFSPEALRATRLPFAFVRSSDLPDNYTSSFMMPGDPKSQPRTKGWKSAGVHLSGSVAGNPLPPTLLVLQKGTRWLSYGVIAAQRRPHGQIWLVLAGLSGPETFAGAQILGLVVKALPEGSDSKPAPVLWGVYEASIEERPLQAIGDDRTLLDQRLLFQDYWP